MGGRTVHLLFEQVSQEWGTFIEGCKLGPRLIAATLEKDRLARALAERIGDVNSFLPEFLENAPAHQQKRVEEFTDNPHPEHVDEILALINDLCEGNKWWEAVEAGLV